MYQSQLMAIPLRAFYCQAHFGHIFECTPFLGGKAFKVDDSFTHQYDPPPPTISVSEQLFNLTSTTSKSSKQKHLLDTVYVYSSCPWSKGIATDFVVPLQGIFTCLLSPWVCPGWGMNMLGIALKQSSIPKISNKIV